MSNSLIHLFVRGCPWTSVEKDSNQGQAKQPHYRASCPHLHSFHPPLNFLHPGFQWDPDDKHTLSHSWFSSVHSFCSLFHWLLYCSTGFILLPPCMFLLCLFPQPHFFPYLLTAVVLLDPAHHFALQPHTSTPETDSLFQCPWLPSGLLKEEHLMSSNMSIIKEAEIQTCYFSWPQIKSNPSSWFTYFCWWKGH